MKTIAQAVGAELSDAAADAIAAVVEKRMRDLINVRPPFRSLPLSPLSGFAVSVFLFRLKQSIHT